MDGSSRTWSDPGPSGSELPESLWWQMLRVECFALVCASQRLEQGVLSRDSTEIPLEQLVDQLPLDFAF